MSDYTSLQASQHEIFEHQDILESRGQSIHHSHHTLIFDEDQSVSDFDPKNIFTQFLLVIKISVGPVISTLFYMLTQLIGTYYVGHTNDSVLIAGVGMGNMLINVLAFAVMQGLNGALETLVSQSYGASHRLGHDQSDYAVSMRKNCGVLLNRGRFIVSCVMIPIIILFFLSDKIFTIIHQDKEVAQTACTYVTLMIPGVWAMGQFDSSKKFLSAQIKNSIPVFTQIITTLLHILWCDIFIRQLKLKEIGAAISTNLTFILNMMISDCWMRLDKEKEFKDMIFFFDSSIFKKQQLLNYLKIGVPGMLMVCFEWWAFEILAIFTGYISVKDLAAEVVIINIVSLVFMLPLGISFSASALTGNYLGQLKIDLAKRFAFLCILLNVLLTSLIVIFLVFYPDFFSGLLTSQSDVIQVISSTMGVVALYIWFDTIHGVQSGIIRGLGLQIYGSAFTLVCYYIIGLPFSLYLAFPFKQGIKGLWLGFSISCIILDLGFAFIIAYPDWNSIALKMQKIINPEQIDQNPEQF